MSRTESSRRFEKFKIVFAAALIILLLVFSVLYYLNENYTVDEVYVTGNKHYSKEQIEDIVMSGFLGHNSLYLGFKYNNKSVTGVPFVEMMDVEIISPKKIAITVYEKTIAGCVEYLDRYIYFDKDGIIVESLAEKRNDVPCISGLDFDHVVLYEPLPVGDENVFREILSVTQLLAKYEIYTDRIYFDSEKHVNLYFDNAKVALGAVENIDEKMIQLKNIIPKLEGLSGTLYMDRYSDDSDLDYITFQRDDVEQHEDIYEEGSNSVSQNTASGNMLFVN